MNQHAIDPLSLEIETFGPGQTRLFGVTVAVPAKDEEERIVACLRSFDAQTGIDFTDLAVVVLLNNCRDGSLEAIRRFGSEVRFHLVAASVELPPQFANAGWARRLAMEHAAGLTSDDGYILTTDADSVADKTWISETLRAFELGVDAVAGFVTADWSELSQLPPDVLAQGADEWAYQNLAAELEAKADPVPHDPWPRHNQNCGASTAIRADLYRALGGLIPLPVGEDRALFDAVRLRDGLIRHSLAAHVVASARTVGRAKGGMADALQTRGSASYECDEILEPALITWRRNAWRHEARARWCEGRLEDWLIEKRIDLHGFDDRWASAFGVVWSEIERRVPRLARVRMRSEELPRELRRIKKILKSLALPRPVSTPQR
ncbi:MAG: glycosyltransferase family 2 protein [Beijerinckiaceae bacterium]|nr:glycosyltransferase family 2 protein [Beijerinckiaceae bacterium]